MSRIIIAVAVYDTDENGRTEYTKKTFNSLLDTIDEKTTDVVFVNNSSCQDTAVFLDRVVCGYFKVVDLDNNIGTAEAINLGWKEASSPEDYLIKLDNDVTFSEFGWADKMRACIESDPLIGVLGLKRKDLPNAPSSNEYPTKLRFADREHGNTWHVIEECDDIIGTCHMFNPKLIDKIGYLYQPGLYGFDDVLACERSRISGFKNAFYPSIEMEHIDTSETKYIEWKRKYAGSQFEQVNKLINGYRDGSEPVYYNPFDEKDISL